MRATSNSDQAKTRSRQLPDHSLRHHIQGNRRRHAWRQTERRYLMRRLRNVIIDLGQHRPAKHELQ